MNENMIIMIALLIVAYYAYYTRCKCNTEEGFDNNTILRDRGLYCLDKCSGSPSCFKKQCMPPNCETTQASCVGNNGLTQQTAHQVNYCNEPAPCNQSPSCVSSVDLIGMETQDMNSTVTGVCTIDGQTLVQEYAIYQNENENNEDVKVWNQ